MQIDDTSHLRMPAPVDRASVQDLLRAHHEPSDCWKSDDGPVEDHALTMAREPVWPRVFPGL